MFSFFVLHGASTLGLQLRRSGKLNSTHHSKLRRSTQDTFYPLCTAVAKKESLVYCGSRSRQATVHKRLFFLPRVLRRLVNCISCSRHWCAAVWVLLYGPVLFLKEKSKKASMYQVCNVPCRETQISCSLTLAMNDKCWLLNLDQLLWFYIAN